MYWGELKMTTKSGDKMEQETYETYDQEIEVISKEDRILKRIEKAVLFYIIASFIIPITIGLFVDFEFSIFHSWIVFLLLICGPTALFVFITYMIIRVVKRNQH